MEAKIGFQNKEMDRDAQPHKWKVYGPSLGIQNLTVGKIQTAENALMYLI
jgi:hypothetical protein